MKIRPALALIALTCSPCGMAAVKVEVVRSDADKGFKLAPVPAPSTNDAATSATFTLVEGARDANSGDLEALHDGRLPTEADEPTKNFFFQNGSEGGRLVIDLGRGIPVKSVHTYSWHPRSRSPQVYQLYAAKGDERGFVVGPKRPADPRSVGWQAIAVVDTRIKGQGGQVATLVTATPSLGEFRYLLFDVRPTDDHNPQSNTFFSEIDVVDANGPAPQSVPGKQLVNFSSKDGKYEFVLDATVAPDLIAWTEKELMPVVEDWYPKMAALLPSANYSPPGTVKMEFRDDMGGIPAYAAGNKLSMNAPWFRTQLKGEAKGCVIHEMVHIIQNYWRAAATNPHPTSTPGWVTEGIPDYIRWFLYEPQSNGARLTPGNFANARYDSSYRITANFLDWVVKNYDKDIIRKLNAAAREGNYSEAIWQDAAGKTVEELGMEWRAANAKRLGLPPSS